MWNALFGIFGECWVCPRALDQFLLSSFVVLGGGRKPNLCGSVLSMPLFGVFGWSVTLAFLLASIRTSKSYGIGLGALLLFGAMHTIILEECLSLICREIGKLCFFDVLI